MTQRLENHIRGKIGERHVVGDRRPRSRTDNRPLAEASLNDIDKTVVEGKARVRHSHQTEVAGILNEPWNHIHRPTRLLVRAAEVKQNVAALFRDGHMNTQRSIKTDNIVVQRAVRLVGAVRHGLKCATELPGDAGHELRTSGRDNFHAETTAQLLHTLSPHATRPHLPAQIS